MWWYVLFFLPVAVLLWLVYEWWEHRWIQYATTEVEFQKLPKNQELRLCLVSDLHNNRKDIEQLTKRIGAFSPEVILLAGDLVNKHKTQNLHAEKFLKAVAALSVPVLYSAGNHELSLAENYPEEWNRYLKKLPSNVQYLENESVLLPGDRGICISGLSLPAIFYKKGSLHNQEESLPELALPEHKLHILMAHHPEYAGMYKKYQADFIVSGHLHGGLLRLPFVGGVLSPRLRLPDCDAGQKKLPDGSTLFVSRGLGSHTIPLRFFNRVEVNFLILKGTGN